MPNELVKIKDYIIPKICVDIESSPKEDFEVSVNMAVNIMIPKDTEKEECIIEIKLEYVDKNKKPVLSSLLRGYVDVDTSVEEDGKKKLLREKAVPFFYDVFRKFIGEISEKTKMEFPNIPTVEEVGL